MSKKSSLLQLFVYQLKLKVSGEYKTGDICNESFYGRHPEWFKLNEMCSVKKGADDSKNKAQTNYKANK